MTQHERRKQFKIFNLNKINRSILKGCKGGILHWGALSFWTKPNFQNYKKKHHFWELNFLPASDEKLRGTYSS
jgi:hypothetical protein